jgi:putative ATPase
MIYAGEDPRFILRRLIILSGEDIGMADPQGLMVANVAAQAFEYVGMPEGIYPIVEATLYLATAPKSNSAGAYYQALENITQSGAGDVPTHLMDASRDGPAMGHGKGYKYPHLYPGHFIPQQYLPSSVLGTVFYKPSDQGYEAGVADRLARWRAAQAAALASRLHTAPPEENGNSSTDPSR